MTTAYYTKIHTEIGEIYIASSKEGVCKISLEGEEPEDFFHWLNRYFDDIEEDFTKNETVVNQLIEYIQGKTKTFDVKLHLIGTEFQKKVWNTLLEVPYGRVASYKEIALAAGSPRGFRAVGMANNKNNIPIVIPCHRIIGHDGDLVGYGGGLPMKVKLLELEGVKVNGRKVVTRE